MKVLLLAPQPFFRERGTPIAVRLLAETLCEAGHEVDLLAYHEGEDISFPGLRVLRIPRVPLVVDVPIGFSWKKLVCDAFFTVSFLRLARPGRYDVVHAVEESLFIAAPFARRRAMALVCDLDSDLADQLIGGLPFLRPLRRLFEGLQRAALRRADLVLAVCPSLARKARGLAPGVPVHVLEDIPLGGDGTGAEDLRRLFGVNGPLALYVGNLELYQGIDLLLEGLALAGAETALSLVLIGGVERDIARYRERARALGLEGRVHFTGPRPLEQLGGYLGQGDILVSPRSRGENTPMKIYSYLASGRAILATGIESHTQALDETCALLVPAAPIALAEGLQRLATDADLRKHLGEAGARRAKERYSREAFRGKLLSAYDRIGGEA